MNNLLAWTGSLLAIAGAINLAIKSPYQALSWPIWLVASILTAVASFNIEMYQFMLRDFTFVLTNLVGVWVWCISPRLGRADQPLPRSRS